MSTATERAASPVTADAGQRGGRGRDRAAGRRAVSGTWPLLRFALRRERLGLPVWLLAAGSLVAVQASQSKEFFSTPEELATLRATAEGNAAFVAMAGPVELVQSAGGEAVFEIFAYVAVVVALMSMFLVGRHTRADEEAGRTELVRSARVGRHAPLAAAVALAVLANAGVVVAVAVGAAATGLPLGGSVVLGAAVASVGLAFTGLTALACQVFENARGAYGGVVAVLGAVWVARAVGDVGDGTLSWLSPIGWGQRTYPYSEDRWWPLLLSVAVLAVTVAIAAVLVEHRDFGAGLLQSRLGPARASRTLGSALGLAWRLHRGLLLGWAAGVLVLGAVMGSFDRGMEEFVADNPEFAEFLPGGGEAIVDSFFALIVAMAALMAASFGVSVVLRARAEETSGRAEPLLATATSRWTWLGGHLTVALAGSALLVALCGLGLGLSRAASTSDAGQLPRLVGLSLGYVPGVWVVVGVALLLVGLLPRAASPVAWLLVAYAAVVAFFGETFELPGWARRLSPVDSVPDVPLEDLAATPLLALGGVAAVLVAAGLAGFRRRDLEST